MTDTQYFLKCPACGQNMQKVRIPDTGFTIDICNKGCGGILFDNQELRKIFNFDESLNKILVYMEGKEFVPIDSSQVRICPVCGTPMVKIGAKSGVEIDGCNSCGATFLDNGELENLRNIIKTK